MDLRNFAKQAKADADRLEELKKAIQILGMNPCTDNLQVEVSFYRTSEEWTASREVKKHIDNSWDVIRLEVMHKCQDEVDGILSRYSAISGDGK